MNIEKDYLTEYSLNFYTEELKIQFFSTISKKKQGIYDKWYEKDYFLLYIRSGKFSVSSNGKSVELNDGDIFLCKPYQTFELIALKENVEMKFPIISFHPSLLETCDQESKIYRVFEARENEELCVYKKEELGEIDSIFQKADKYSKKSFHKDVFKSLTTMLLFELCIIHDKYHQYIPAKFSHEYDLKIYSYIQSRILTKIKITDVTKEFFVSEWYVNKVCKKFYNMNFREMLKDSRMWAAKSFMINKQTNDLHKVAELCGYNDYSAFYKTYKKYFGISPKDDLMFYQKNKYFYQKNLDNE